MNTKKNKSAIRLFARNIVRRLRQKKKGKLAIGNITDVTSVYNDVFKNVDNYDCLDTSNEPKLKYVLRYVKPIKGKVLDAGCGRGSVLRYMLENGVDAFGIELSPVAVEKYLQGMPVANADIVAWAEQGHTYDGCISTDVMEHIPPDQIDATLAALSKLSPSVFLGIANHSSVHNGHELHVIQEGVDWWKRKIAAHFRTVEVVKPDEDDPILTNYHRKEVFFFIKATR